MIRRMRFKKTTQRVMVLLTIVCTVTALASQTIAFGITSRNQIWQESMLDNEETLSKMWAELTSHVHSLTTKMQTIYTQTDMISYMQDFSEDSGTTAYYYWQAWTLFQNRFDSEDGLLAMYIYDNNDQLISSHRKIPYEFPYDLYTTDIDVNIDAVDSFLLSDDTSVCISGYYNREASKNVVRLILKMHTYDASRTQYGYLICDFDSTSFTSIMSKYISIRDVYVWMQSPGDIAISATGNTTSEELSVFRQLSDSIRENDLDVGLENEYGTFYMNASNKVNNVRIYMLTPQSLFMATQNNLLKMLLIISLITIGVTALLGTFISRGFSHPVKEMQDTVTRIKNGETNLRVTPVGWSEELQVLGTEFNEMVDRVQKMAEEEYASKLLAERSQYKALQAQINPHFLYNTLNTMSAIANSQNCTLVSGLCLSLSEIFRYSFDISDSLSTLQKEMAHVRNYLYVMDVRNGNSIKYEYHIEADTLQDTIPRITLQPIVENALQHGLRNSRKKDKKLTISSRHEGENLQISIEDNGIGMDAAAMNNELEIADIKRVEIGHSIGVLNVNKRLKIVYGDSYGLHYESTPEQGTKVLITIPAEMEDA